MTTMKIPWTSGLQRMATEWTGPRVLDLATLEAMALKYSGKGGEAAQIEYPKIRLRGVRATLYRMTVLTARGYLTSYVEDGGTDPSSPDGSIDVGLALLEGLIDHDEEPDRRARLGSLLREATTLDLSTRFPVLIEVDTRAEFSGRREDFVADRANFEPVWLILDRRFATWFK